MTYVECVLLLSSPSYFLRNICYGPWEQIPVVKNIIDSFIVDETPSLSPDADDTFDHGTPMMRKLMIHLLVQLVTMRMKMMRMKMTKPFLLLLAASVLVVPHNAMGKLDIVGETTSWFNDDTFNIAGEINNNGTRDVDFVEVIATLYNSDGTVIGSDSIYTNPSTIEVGDTSPFQFRITDLDVLDVGEIDTYKISVSGD